MQNRSYAILLAFIILTGLSLLSIGIWLTYDRSRVAGVPFRGYVVKENGRYFWQNKGMSREEIMNPEKYGTHEITHEQYEAYENYWPDPELFQAAGGFTIVITFIIFVWRYIKRQGPLSVALLYTSNAPPVHPPEPTERNDT